MALGPGTRVGSFEISAQIGAGGMGIVYRARDGKLQRDVALKVLPDLFSRDPHRLSRFRREAQVLASLNHPNIAAIYGLEETDGAAVLVLELVDGPTLAECIAAGSLFSQARGRAGHQWPALALDEALATARQIAGALESAHERGIIHRDLKPANVKITHDGRVKVLDFGLAKALTADDPFASVREGTEDASASQASTVTAATEPGVVLGTASYMSPEQMRGRPVDRRADIWAFGCLLYEMLAGRRAFRGETLSDTMAAVLTGDPDWAPLPSATPPHVRRLLQRCLEKDPARRLRDIGDANLDLEDDLAAPAFSAAAAATPAKAPSQPRRTAAWLLAAAVAVLAGGAAVWSLRPGSRESQGSIVRFTIPLPAGMRPSGDAYGVAFSPNGEYIAYVSADLSTQGSPALYLRRLSDGQARLISASGNRPFFSPDGQWLGFAGGGKLWKVPAGGGPPVAVADAPGPRGASWGDDGAIVFAPLSRAGLSRVESEGGTPEVITNPDERRGETSHRLPHVLPGASGVIYTAEGGVRREMAAMVFSFETGQHRVLIEGARLARYVRAGYLVYMQADTVLAAPFDVRRLQVTGPPMPVLENVQAFSVSDTGSLVYVSQGGRQGSRSTLVWVNHDGSAEPLPATSGSRHAHPDVSPDGGRVVFEVEDQGERQIWTYDLVRDVLAALTTDGANLWPLWTPQGDRVVYASNRAPNSWDVFSIPVDATGREEALLTKVLTQIPRHVSPDGRVLALSESHPVTGGDVWLLDLADMTARPFLQTRALEEQPAFSPDGRWLAYASSETGRMEVYVTSLTGESRRWRVSTAGGVEPLWSPNGRELFYRNGSSMLAVDVTTEPSFASGRTRELFSGPYRLSDTGGRDYDVTADGERFLMIRTEQGETAPGELNVVLNWVEELKARAPAN